MSSRHERRIAIPGTKNFRDLGGYRTDTGKTVTMYKHVFRSDELSRVTPSGVQQMRDKLKIKYTIDFRSPDEVKSASYKFPGIERVAIPMVPVEILDTIKSEQEVTEALATGLVMRFAQTFLADQQVPLRKFFSFLLDTAKGTPIVMHCSAGKDRTGVTSALLLYVLGVPEKTIYEDFLLTNETVERCPKALVLGNCRFSPEAVNVLIFARPDFFRTVFEAAKTTFGGLDHYIRHELGLTPDKIAALRKYYTRPSSSSR